MTTSLRKFARVLLLLGMGAVGGYWLSAGAHSGWSMNRVPVEQTDEITGLVFTTYEERYVPGIEVLGGSLAAGLILLGFTYFPFKKTKCPTTPS